MRGSFRIRRAPTGVEVELEEAGVPIGETDLPLAPGLVVAKGDSLCAVAEGSVAADVSVSGYTVSFTDAPTGAVQRRLAIPQQK